MRTPKSYRLLLLSLAVLLLAACGSKGPLTLPADEPAPAPTPSQ